MLSRSSGTNRWQASVFTSVQDQVLVGKDTAGTRANGFDFLQYGATVGGPIIRDKLHLFVAADLQRRRTPFIGPDASDPATGISVTTATRASAAFRTVYGFDAGGPEPPMLSQPDRSVFAKVTWQPSSRHRVELSHNWVDASDENLGRNPRFSALRPGGWALSRSGMVTSDVIHTTRLHATSAFGSLGNELIAGVQTTNEDHASTLRSPLFVVQGDSRRELSGGRVGWRCDRHHSRSAHGRADGQCHPSPRFTRANGGRARGMVSVHRQLLRQLVGSWRFPSVEAFEQKQPDWYQIALPLRPGGPLGDFEAGQVAAYVQDRWTPVERLSVTAGVRADRPHSDVPAENPALASSVALGAGYSRRFAVATQLSPRLGLSWRATNRHAVVVRAGAGMFAARAPQVWLGNEFTSTGLDQATLVCTTKEGVPAPVVELGSLPRQCTKSGGTTPISTAAYIGRGFRSPQVWKSLVGIDAVLTRQTSVSIDCRADDARYQMYVRDANLTPTGTNAEGRAMYGLPGATGSLTPSRPDPAFGQVLAYDSRGGDHSAAVSVSATKRWSNGSIGQVGYQWSRAVDVLTLFNPGGMLMFQNSALDGTIDARRQTRSGTDVPHSLVASAVARLPFAAQASFLLRAQSGRPYSYTMSGDANADGVSLNDLFHVPRDSADVSLTNPERWGELDRYVESHACLRAQRGRIMAGNSCRNPAVLTLDGRLAKTVSLGGIQRMEIGVDVFNLPNLLNRDWGLVRETASNQSVAMLGVSGWDPAFNRPQYKFLPGGLPVDNVALVDASRWKIQLGMRYWLAKTHTRRRRPPLRPIPRPSRCRGRSSSGRSSRCAPFWFEATGPESRSRSRNGSRRTSRSSPSTRRRASRLRSASVPPS